MTGNPLAPLLDRQGVVVLDGGLATELEARGFDLKDELWSARLLQDDPEAIRDLHRAYVGAGADCVITASYQATVESFRERGLREEEALELLRLSVRLAREANPELVAASVGPYGAMLADGSEYTGAYDLDEEQLGAWHRPRFEVLDACGADLLACETIPSRLEARALAKLLNKTPAWFSFSCRDGEHISDGTPIEQCIREAASHDRVVAVGINCTAPRFIVALIDAARNATKKPIVVYPNSGEHYDAARMTWSGSRDAEAFAEAAVAWRQAGASLIGGCCRTGPAHIAALRARLGKAGLLRSRSQEHG
ncbi:MAG: homocysteine S-methyltransferase [Planctomycetota bacterium]|jgi:homocysteine S-methyltransferase